MNHGLGFGIALGLSMKASNIVSHSGMMAFNIVGFCFRWDMFVRGEKMAIRTPSIGVIARGGNMFDLLPKQLSCFFASISNDKGQDLSTGTL